MPPKKAKRSKANAAQGTGPKGVDAKTVGRWRSVRGRRGGLQAFMDMPVDVIQEICLFLHPQDLLSLSRVTKNFHEHLMSKKSAWIWKQSLGRVDGLPPRPSELIEPAWIALVYSPTCTLCGNGRATDVYWVVLARVCATCRKNVFVADNKVRTILNDSQASLVRGGIPSNTLIQIEGVTGFKKRCYFVPQLMDALQAYEALPHPRYLHMKPFIDEWKKRTKAHTEFASKCINWTSAQRKAEKLEAQRITTARLTDIGARLRDLGWDREVDFLVKEDFKPLSDFNPLWQVKALTDRAWQNMRSELLLHMEDVKAQRLERETWAIWAQRWAVLDTVGKELLDRYYAKHPETMLYRLRIADLALEKEVRNIMCKPRDVDVGKEQFLALEGAIEAIVDRWQTRVCKQFRGLLTGGKIKASKDIDVLVLATTMFSGCDWPTTHQEFPEVVGNLAVRPYNQAYAGQDAYRHFQRFPYR